jgi:hypothetical protein
LPTAIARSSKGRSIHALQQRCNRAFPRIRAP